VELVLTKLGDLDPGEGREGPAGHDELYPGGFGITTPAEPPQEPGPLPEQAALGPRLVAPDGIRGGPGVGEGILTRTASEIGPAPG
jgi:hypothetical protein